MKFKVFEEKLQKFIIDEALTDMFRIHMKMHIENLYVFSNI